MPKMVRIAGILALLIGVFAAINGYLENPILIPLALIPLIAGIGIMRKRAWSAYGYALVLASQLLLAPVILLRSGSSRAELIAGTLLIIITALIFFFAGKSLGSLGAQHGSPIPWIVVSVLLTMPLLFVRPFVIPTGAMENTLLTGDHILVQSFPKPQPVRDGLMVFQYPVDPRQTFVKRVIGAPGDRIKLHDKVVYRNGVALSEPYVAHLAPYPDSYRDNFPDASNLSMRLFPPAQEMLQKNVVNGEVVVPPEKYFVLGDNRDNSLDSRYWGFVDIADYLGKPFLIYESEDRPTELTPTEQRHPRRIRWERFFKPI